MKARGAVGRAPRVPHLAGGDKQVLLRERADALRRPGGDIHRDRRNGLRRAGRRISVAHLISISLTSCNENGGGCGGAMLAVIVTPRDSSVHESTTRERNF